jgi:GTP-binding protein
LGRLTRAAPKVADYPFTTLSPVLGTIEDEDRQAVLADIPGLIEGAAEGSGLGHEFLAHVERCAMLVHLVDLAPLEGEPAANYEAVREELASYGAGLARLPELLVLSKRDLLPPDQVEEEVRAWGERMGERVLGVVAVSAATGEGVEELRRAVLSHLESVEPASGIAAAAPGQVAAGGRSVGGGLASGEDAQAPPAGQFEAEHRVYRPAGEGGYWVEREEDGAFRVAGRGVEMLFERHDLANEEALGYLESRLNEMGVVAALRAAGFEPGDEVRVGEHEFELHP